VRAVKTCEEAIVSLGHKSDSNVGIWTLVSSEMANCLSVLATQIAQGLMNVYDSCDAQLVVDLLIRAAELYTSCGMLHR
jgi:hypothetical protein